VTIIQSTYAFDVSKPSLAWQFNAVAVQLCQTLGYHHGHSGGLEDEPSKERIAAMFWLTYLADKNLSLRLGRPSIIQDWDITIPRTIRKGIMEDPYPAIITNWIKHAELQPRIYDLL
jgi:hypothetical protein